MLHSLIDFYEPGDVKTGIHHHCQVGCLIPKKHNDEYDVVSAISDLARAMVGFSYGSDHEEVIEYTSHFYNILSGSPDKEEVSKKDNIIYLNKWNNDD